MSLERAKPTSPGRRAVVKVVSDDPLHKGRPERSLVRGKKRISGRNNEGRTTVWRRGGGHKRLYRIIDFKRRKHDGIKGKVERIEYDPNRSANIALIIYENGAKSYIVAPDKLKKGDYVESGDNVPAELGNCLLLENAPIGSVLHCVELSPGGGAQIARSAGASVQLLSKEGKYATLRLKSSETRKVLLACRAVIGVVSNPEKNLASLGKAGAKRWIGRRPVVRGVAMNPVDHPHGGGEGRTSGGRHPVTPFGVPTKGYKTRRNKDTSRFIVKGRKKP